jgi:hypothetical protein
MDRFLGRLTVAGFEFVEVSLPITYKGDAPTVFRDSKPK